MAVVSPLQGTFMYANAGNNLASINHFSDIASIEVLGAFVLLGLFSLIPLSAKGILHLNPIMPSKKLG